MATATTPAVPTLIGSVRRALRLLESAGAHPNGAPAKQLAREAGLPLPTAYHLLRTLTHEGYLRREKGVFFLGDAVDRLVSGAGPRLGPARRTMAESMEHCRDLIGAPVYFAIYREGEIEIVAVADSPAAPAVAEWADFRETAHAHAIGQCLLSQLDEDARRDHLDRHPVGPLTPFSVADRRTLLSRLAAMGRTGPVLERQEYVLGQVCAAVPIRAGATVAALATSVPLHQEERLLPAVERLCKEIGNMIGSLEFSISI
ncbi:IclR family transcriptional regulator C-terminal domain-containing protein [Streptomyces sp. PSRA5]|uniref:IclR family transcriptional regulator n=1 Tax=Streptomyces panacea TaxID=3035064 RepID=UPI00339CA0E9